MADLATDQLGERRCGIPHSPQTSRSRLRAKTAGVDAANAYFNVRAWRTLACRRVRTVSGTQKAPAAQRHLQLEAGVGTAQREPPDLLGALEPVGERVGVDPEAAGGAAEAALLEEGRHRPAEVGALAGVVVAQRGEAVAPEAVDAAVGRRLDEHPEEPQVLDVDDGAAAGAGAGHQVEGAPGLAVGGGDPAGVGAAPEHGGAPTAGGAEVG